MKQATRLPSYISAKLRLHIFELKQKEKQKNIHVKHFNKHDYNKPYSKEQLARAIQGTKNSAPGPDKIHNEMYKHLPSEG